MVSIVIPVYRGDPYLSEAISSALAQSWPEIEVVVVNDGSDDDGKTRAIAERFGNRVRYLEKENGGVATALNAGIDAARGEYISWLSHDDRYHPLKVERQMEVLRAQPEPAIVFGDYDLIDKNGNHLARLEMGSGVESGHPLWTVLEGRLNGCAMLVPRICFERCGLFSAGRPTTQDYDLWFRMAREFPFVHAPGAFVQHRDHEGQGSKIARHLEEVSLLWLSMIDRLDPGEMEAAAGSETRFLIRALRWLRRSPFQAVTANLEARLSSLLAERKVSLVWGSSSSDIPTDIPAAVMQIEQAGPQVAQVVIAETKQTTAAMEVRGQLASTGMATYWIAPDRLGSDVLKLAQGAEAPEVLIMDADLGMTAEDVRTSLEMLYMDEADMVLRKAGHSGDRDASCLPRALRGAALSVDALRGKDLAEAETSGMSAALQGLRVEIATGNGPAAQMPAQPVRPAPRLDAPDTSRPTLLIVSRGRGGGTSRYANTVGRLASGRCNVLYLKGIDDKELRLSAVSADDAGRPFAMPEDLEACLDLLSKWNVGRVDVVHSDGLGEHLPTILERLGVPYDVTMVDFHLVAQSPHLEDEQPDEDPEPAVSPILVDAERRIAISRRTAQLCSELAPDLSFKAVRLPEPHNPTGFDLHPAPLNEGETLRVWLPAPLLPHKGSEIILEVTRRCRLAELPIEFHLTEWAGPDLPEPEVQNNLRIHGRAAQDFDLNQFICVYRPHLAWLPFVVEETHSFLTSDVMLQGMPILASAIGALPERLEGREATWLVEPPLEADAHEAWLRRLCDERLETPPHWVATDDLPPLEPRFYQERYLEPLLASANSA